MAPYIPPYTERPDIYERFMSHVQVCDHGVQCTECCWLWKTPKQRYAMFSPRTNEVIGAHVFMYFWAHRKINPLYTLHTCDVSLCVQPNHLWSGTQQDNIHDKIRKGRANQKGENNNNARFTEGDIELIYELYGIWDWTVSEIARSIGVPSQIISPIVHGKIWSYVEEKLYA